MHKISEPRKPGYSLWAFRVWIFGLVLAAFCGLGAANAATCFAVDDDSGRIVTFDRDAPLNIRFTTTIAGWQGGVGVVERVEAAYFDAVQNRYYAVDQGGTDTFAINRLMWIDPFSGQITYIGASLGTTAVPTAITLGTGNAGNRVVGLTRNPVSNRWYGVLITGILFEVDVTTGRFISGSFGGNDYLQVRNPDGSPANATLEDLAFDASGQLFALKNASAPTQFLRNIDLNTGVAASSVDLGLSETEGLALTNGEMRVIIGANGSAATVRDVYRLDTGTGALTLIFKLPNIAASNADYEAKGCNDSFLRADLALRKQVVGPSVGPPGTTFTFQLTVEHQGIDPAHRIQITDVLDAGLSFASSTIASPCVSCSFDPFTGIWTVGYMDIGMVRTLTLLVSSSGGVSDTPYLNRAQVTTVCDSATGPCVALADFDSTPNNKSGNWTPTEDDEATASIILTERPSVTKRFTPASGPAGSTALLVISIVNPNTSTSATFTTFTDAYPAGMQNANTPTAVTSCTGAAAAATAGANTVNISGAPISIANNGGCGITVTVVVASGIGAYINDIPTGSLTTNIGTNVGTSASYSVTPANINVIKDFSIDAIGVSQTSTLRLTFSNPTPVTATFVNGFTDTFPSGLLVAAPANPATSCIGSGAPTTTTNSVGLPNTRAIPPSGQCTLTVEVTATTRGLYTNTIPMGGVQTSVGSNFGQTQAVLLVDAPRVSKSFNPSFIAMGSSATLTISLTNPLNRSATLTAIFIDQYPAGLVNTTPVSVNDTCPAGVAAANAGGNTVTLPIGTIIPPLGICQINVAVTSASSATYVNTIAAGSLTTALGSNTSATQATLTVATLSDLRVIKAVNLSNATPTQTLSYTVTVVNLGPATATAATLSDQLQGVGYIGPLTIAVSSAATTVTARTTSSTSINATMTIPSGQTVSFVFTGTATIYNGFVTNTAVVASGVGQTDPNVVNNSATVLTLITPTAALAVTKTNGVTALTAGQTTSYTITFANGGLSSADGAVVQDFSTPGLNCVALTCTATGGAVCGVISVAAFQAGHPLPTFPNGGRVEIVLRCNVTATGF